MKEIEDIKSIIDDLVRDLNMESKLNVTNIFSHWEEIVGTEINKKARPEKIVRNTLYISVTSSTWANELRMMSGQLINRINSFIGEDIVKSIKFKQNL
jgi:predicted nucleic acid-binding Zn ribbon protein